ncbi:uncharacterized protein F4807DRAFT_364598 [Annulohypoxylon truncatum]|uniref:uncharacterized protein n=1 Tax=Annulohypoxylon truncatum TaxID=327061 RepID=UPI0020079B83|nr:uncharacterized protein F4807DRAFT_364598 [Annulohypoxylon truncatum]KAI1212253.1 hypothetical protein F4807DRAFT_364598 [Annulohypoxylon truncatum]
MNPALPFPLLPVSTYLVLVIPRCTSIRRLQLTHTSTSIANWISNTLSCLRLWIHIDKNSWTGSRLSYSILCCAHILWWYAKGSQPSNRPTKASRTDVPRDL